MLKALQWFNVFYLVGGLLFLSGCVHQRPSPEYIPAAKASRHVPTAHQADHDKVKIGTPYQVAGVWYYPLASNERYDRTGMASWYGKKFNGKKTANGERYDMYAMTAAHTTLPMPSRVRVTNLSNGRSVVVRVNDRGPFVKDRMIDLSYAAAKALGYMRQGTTRVRVQTLDANGRTSNTHSREHQRERKINGRIYIQLAAFRSFQSANQLWQRLAQDYPSADILHGNHDDLYRVRLGPFANEWRSEKIQAELKDEGYAHPMIVVQ